MCEELPLLSIDGKSIQREQYTKFLGILIDENINWKVHISHLHNKISKSIGVLYRVRHYLNKKLLQQLYFSFVHSHLTYGNIAWGSTYKSNLNSLYRRQKHALRIINFKERNYPTKILFQNSNILTLYEINIQKILCLMFTFKLDSRLDDLNVFQQKPKSKYSMRSDKNIYQPTAKLRCKRFSIQYRGPKLWNHIVLKSKELSEIKTKPIFKRKLRKHLVNLGCGITCKKQKIKSIF